MADSQIITKTAQLPARTQEHIRLVFDGFAGRLRDAKSRHEFKLGCWQRLESIIEERDGVGVDEIPEILRLIDSAPGGDPQVARPERPADFDKNLREIARHFPDPISEVWRRLSKLRSRAGDLPAVHALIRWATGIPDDQISLLRRADAITEDNWIKSGRIRGGAAPDESIVPAIKQLENIRPTRREGSKLVAEGLAIFELFYDACKAFILFCRKNWGLGVATAAALYIAWPSPLPPKVRPMDIAYGQSTSGSAPVCSGNTADRRTESDLRVIPIHERIAPHDYDRCFEAVPYDGSDRTEPALRGTTLWSSDSNDKRELCNLEILGGVPQTFWVRPVEVGGQRAYVGLAIRRRVKIEVAIQASDTTASPALLREIAAERERQAADDDGDGLPDVFEPYFGAVVGKPDTDGDGIRDGIEALVHRTSPRDSDSDHDDVPDLEELQQGSTPLVKDRSPGDEEPSLFCAPDHRPVYGWQLGQQFFFAPTPSSPRRSDFDEKRHPHPLGVVFCALRNQANGFYPLWASGGRLWTIDHGEPQPDANPTEHFEFLGAVRLQPSAYAEGGEAPRWVMSGADASWLSRSSASAKPVSLLNEYPRLGPPVRTIPIAEAEGESSLRPHIIVDLPIGP